MVRTLGALVGAAEKAEDLAGSLQARLDQVVRRSAGRPRPRVYFEEWDDPLIAGIGWVSELIEIAGGEDVFASLRRAKAAKDRIVAPGAVIAARPDVILAYWCGKKLRPARIARPRGVQDIPAAPPGPTPPRKPPPTP